MGTVNRLLAEQATGRAHQLPLNLGGPHSDPGLHPRPAVRGRGGEVPAQPCSTGETTSPPRPR